MRFKNHPLLYFLLIILGAVLAFIGQGKGGEDRPYILIAGFVLLMYGLYGATAKWVKDNPRDNSNENREEEEE